MQHQCYHSAVSIALKRKRSFNRFGLKAIRCCDACKDRLSVAFQRQIGARQWANPFLSETALVAWIDYVLNICIDQVSFMVGLLDLESMKGRLEAYPNFEAFVAELCVRHESLSTLRFLFARLWPEAEADAADASS